MNRTEIFSGRMLQSIWSYREVRFVSPLGVYFTRLSPKTGSQLPRGHGAIFAFLSYQPISSTYPPIIRKFLLS